MAMNDTDAMSHYRQKPDNNNTAMSNLENDDCSLLQSHLINENNNSLISLEDQTMSRKGSDLMYRSRLRRSEYMFNDSSEGMLKSHDKNLYLSDNRENFQADQTAYSFSTNNQLASSCQQPKKASTTPLREKYTSNQKRNTEERVHNSDYQSRSRSRSGYRKIDQSPIEVNTSFELSQKNTQTLWKEFKENLRDNSSSRHPLQEPQPANISTTVNARIDPVLVRKEERSIGNRAHSTDYLDKNHAYKESYASNVDTNQFINTSKSELKNTVLQERHLKKLIKVSGDASNTLKSKDKNNISFDKNAQILPSRVNDSGTNKLSRASQFTFNSTDK